MNYPSMYWNQLGALVLFGLNSWLFDLEGRPVGFIERDGSVYTTQGRHVAWLQGGVLRDLYGYCLAVGDQIEDPVHPPLPALQPARRLPAIPFCPAVCPPAGVAAPPPMPHYIWSQSAVSDLLG